MKEKLLIIGAGGHARSCADVIEQEGRFEIFGFVDSYTNQTSLFNYPIFACDDDLPRLFKQCKFAFLGIGQIKSADLRVNLYEKLKSIGFALPTIISPLAYIAKSAQIDNEATIIMHHALVNANAKVGKACIINSKALIEHDAIIEDFCHISTAACINGGCKVGQRSFVASNTALKHAQIIPSDSLVYHNTTLIKSAVVTGGGGNPLNSAYNALLYFLPLFNTCIFTTLLFLSKDSRISFHTLLLRIFIANLQICILANALFLCEKYKFVGLSHKNFT